MLTLAFCTCQSSLVCRYRACTPRHAQPSGSTNKTFRLYFRFLNLQGVITYFDSDSTLEQMVIIDPMWLLRAMTCIVRRPHLHPHAADHRFCESVPFKQLYDRGILEPSMFEYLWPEEDYSQAVKTLVLGTMLKHNLYVRPRHLFTSFIHTLYIPVHPAADCLLVSVWLTPK